MISYLLKILTLAIFSFIIIYFYYFSNWGIHTESFDWYLVYVVIVWIIYSIYKFFQLEISEKKASFSLFKIFSFFLLHLFILCMLFFSYNNLWLWYWILLFSKIIFYSFFPLLTVLISISFWRKIIWYISWLENESNIYKFLLSLWIWFFSFIFLIDIFGILGFYNLFVVLSILIGLLVFSYKEFTNIIKSIFSYEIKVDIEEWNYLKLISSEFLFLISTLVICISLISIVRPFPIGWDDLGSYMNTPHLIAEAGNTIAIGQMYAWQTFTWIWYLFWSSTQAFFLNNVWWILSFIVLVLIISDLLKSTIASKKKYFLNLPMLAWTIFISMPMVVFQQAKDMKLDPWLFFISIIVVYLVFKYYNKPHSHFVIWKEKESKIKELLSFNIKWNKISISSIIILIIWILAWFAFSIKFTSLLLISAIIWLMSYARLWVVWFVWYLFIFFAIFTKWNLWWMMNVMVNPENISWFETIFSSISWLLWLALFAFISIKNKKIVKLFLIEIMIFILWIFIALFPWLSKNIVDSYPNISIWKIISWTPDRFNFDKSLIYSQEELVKIELEKKRERMSAEWTTKNEDLGRYFGYEVWVNNYLKLPWNLTMQVNQWWEFTDIWFLFLALLPVVLLFLPFRKKYYSIIIVIALILELFVFIKTDNRIINNSDLKQLSEVSKESIFESNNYILRDKNFNKDIYDIDVWNYIFREHIEKLVNKETSFEAIEKRAIDLFYSELTSKVLDKSLWKEIELINTSLSDKDFNFIEELRNLNTNYYRFKTDINSLNILENEIIRLNLGSEKGLIIKLWKDNRSFNQIISDYFSTFNLPFWYVIVLLVFILPVLFFLLTLKHKDWDEWKLINLFKFNLIFASFYTFLWTISAFWIVWYWITMYFSFLLFIVIWASYIVTYNDSENEKKFYIKLFWTFVFFLIFLIYAVNSIFPHSFKNLKWAGYAKYKTWEITIISAPYLYHNEYLKVLFHTNIDQTKREDFIKEYVEADIIKAVSWIEKMDMFKIRLLLNDIIKKDNILARSAKKSLTNIYKNISNPNDKYKSKVWIYRIWTFLKYHISENHKRLLEDNLIFTFNDYIYNSNINTTVDNLKKAWLWYLLVDLNAATIDKDERHNLTTRYEKLLNTFTSERLELIETDSICLKLALEDFNKSEKLSEDRDKFLFMAWVNHESYNEDWSGVWRSTKLLQCYARIDELIKNKKIDTTNYNYLLWINNYIIQNQESFKTENQIFTLLQQQITHWYKVLFKIK